MSKQNTGWKEWLLKQRKKVTVSSKEVSLNKIKPWEIVRGIVKHKEDIFFKISGFIIKIVREDKKFSWKQPLIVSRESVYGWIIIVVARETEQSYFLIHARAEAGWETLGLGPSFQASKSNLLKNPNIPRKEFIEDGNLNLVPQDGSVYYKKKNYVGTIELLSREKFSQKYGQLNDDERWFSESEFYEALAEGEVSGHLLQAVACYKK